MDDPLPDLVCTALGQVRRSCTYPKVSAAPQQADHSLLYLHRLFSANRRHSPRYSITSPAIASNDGGMVTTTVAASLGIATRQILQDRRDLGHVRPSTRREDLAFRD